MTQNNQLTKNLLICGDNLKALDDLKKQGIKADLIYLDPPFFSNKQYEIVWGDEAEVRSFKDRWAGGINVYIEWMRERVVKMYEILKDTGSFYLHCDWHAGHYLKVMLDEVFGYSNFQNEIVWKRTYAHSDPSRCGRIHDIILFYTKSKIYIWNKIYQEPDSDYIDLFFDQYDPARKERYSRLDLTAPKHGDGGNLLYEWKGIWPSKNRTWVCTKDKMEKLDKERRIHYPKKGMPRQKRYESEHKGTVLQDIWTDVKPMHNLSSERLGYPTQKPEALLERIIKASSNESDIILDPFCGCGTAMVAARKLERKWIGIDISPTALTIIERRLAKYGIIKSRDFDVIGMPTTISELKALEPFEFQNWVINEMQAKQSKRLVKDMGINGYYEKTIFTDEAGIQVKQSEKVGRNVVDNFETALRRKKHEKGFIVAFSFTKDAHEEVARVKRKGLDIKLTKVEDLLLGRAEIFKG